jgi:hypothetical protein
MMMKTCLGGALFPLGSHQMKGRDMKPEAKHFKDFLLEELKKNAKTSWGKNELREYILELYADFIERYVE